MAKGSPSSLLDEQLLAKIKAIQIRARYLVNEGVAGQYTSAFKGRGMEFEEVREYVPGDDIRNIDWNVTARMNRPFLKRHRDERELTVIFVVDVSASTEFGSRGKFKNEVSAEVAALLAYSAMRSNDRIGLIVFSDHVERYLPPKKGRMHVWQVIRDILSHEALASGTDFAAPIEFLNRVVKKKAVCFLISDFVGFVSTSAFRLAARRHDCVAIAVSDPRERELPDVGWLAVEDAETGASQLIDTGRAETRAAYRQQSEAQWGKRKQAFRAAGVAVVEVPTGTSYLDPILRFFRQRERQK